MNYTEEETEFKPEMLSDSVILVHKWLRHDDFKSLIAKERKTGQRENFAPLVALDLSTIVSVQEDFKTHNAILVDRRAGLAVHESFDDVLPLWLAYRKRMGLEGIDIEDPSSVGMQQPQN